MNRRLLPAGLLLILGLFGFTIPAVAGTFTMLNGGDAWPSWGCPRINNQGHVAMTRSTTSEYSGGVWLWTGDWATLKSFPGSGVGNKIFQPRLELNNADRIAYTTGGEGVRICDTTGVITLGAAPTSLNYKIDINDAGGIAAYSWAGTGSNRIYGAEAPYVDYTLDVGPTELSVYHVIINNAGQIAWRPSPLHATLYRYTPGVGSQVIGSSYFSPFDMDDQGRIVYMNGTSNLMLNDVLLRTTTALWQSTNQYTQPRISDNGRYIVWTEWTGTLWNLWTMVDGIPTNLTQGAYHQVVSPDVNDEGTIVFAEAINMWVSPFASNVWMYEPTNPEPTVYNGHFDGQTWFGWTRSVSGAGSLAFVARDTSGYAARFTTGSPVSISQTVDVPVGPLSLELELDFLTPTGGLVVTLGGVELARLDADDDTESGFTRVSIPIVGTPPLGQSGAVLDLTVDGEAGSIVEVDGIALVADQTGVREDPAKPAAFTLGQAFPNPSGSGTTLQYLLDRPGRVEAAVFDAAGRRIALLLEGQQPAGPGSIHWRGTNDAGDRVPAGVYFLRLRAGGTAESRKILLAR